MNLLDNTSNQPFRFWVEINDESRGTCNTNNQIKFKTRMLKLNAYVIIVMHVYLLKEIYQLITQQRKVLL